MTSRIVVTGWVGTGTRLDPYRPDVDPVNSTGRGTIMLRGHPRTDTDALCLVVLDYPAASRTPTRRAGSTVNRLTDLGQDTETARLSTTRTAALAAELGVTAPARATIGELVMLAKGSELAAQIDGRFVIGINGHLLHEQQAIQGGATDTFTFANGALQTQDVDWTIVDQSFNIASNAVVAPTAHSDQAAMAVYETAIGADCYAQIVVTNGGSNYREGGPFARKAAVNNTESFYMVVLASDNNIYMYEFASGSGTETGAVGVGTPNGTVKIECNGSTIKAYLDAVEKISVTDSTHTGTFCGIEIYNASASSTVLDNWEANSLGGPAVAAAGPLIVGQGAALQRAHAW